MLSLRPGPQSPLSGRTPPQGTHFIPNLLFLYRKTVNISRNLAFGQRKKIVVQKASGVRSIVHYIMYVKFQQFLSRFISNYVENPQNFADVRISRPQALPHVHKRLLLTNFPSLLPLFADIIYGQPLIILIQINHL